MAMRWKEKPKDICIMYQGPPQPPPQSVPMPYIVNNNTHYPNGNVSFPPTAQQGIPPTAYPQQVPFPSQPQGGQFSQASPDQQVFNQPPQVTQPYHNTAQNANVTGCANSGTLPVYTPVTSFPQPIAPAATATTPLPQHISQTSLPMLRVPYHIRKYLSNLAMLKLYEIINDINMAMGKISLLSFWTELISGIFTPDAVVRYSKKSLTDYREFEFVIPVLPVICSTLGRFGIVRMEMKVLQLKTQVLSNSTIFFNCPRVSFVYYYPDGSYVTHFAQMKGAFDLDLKINWLDISMHSFVPNIEWNAVERLLSDQTKSPEIERILSKLKQEDASDQGNASTENNGTNIPRNFEVITQLRSYFDVFGNVSVFGTQEGLMRVMQISTVMSTLKNLRKFQIEQNIDSPVTALSAYVDSGKNDIGSEPVHTKRRRNSGVSPHTTTSGPGSNLNTNNDELSTSDANETNNDVTKKKMKF
ncbi:YDL233W-like protein [Saccharomyces kudriavzevii IFO 1802]|uniref:YDL233W-like protein n=2 Tax=Saccharomyces kudriavzevii (strain ATCC MYA-4449 / AS 2.2408 / CBS 8840 / NBRC 1802 / NCYC 2889) TaxID=226230 RepID=J6EEV2_SACK1|nr:YDL233W-like protein [Saccharomyces kudriavzevii IFO 1802]